MSLTLIVRDPDGAEHRVEARVGTTLGRHPQNTCVLADPTAGAWHVRVGERDGRLVLEDTGSRNGTRVEDGPRLLQGQCAALEPGARFHLGATVVSVAEAARAARPASAPSTDARLGTVVAERAGGGGGLEVLARRRPRLVVADGPRARIWDLEGPELVVGRTRGGVRIEDLSVSGRHARVLFDPRLGRFFVEDLGSANGTFVDDEVAAPGQRRELRPDSALRFGDVPALWVVEEDDPEVERVRERALRALLRSRRLTRVQVQRAREDARPGGRRPVEMLVLRGALRPDEWVRARRAAAAASGKLELDRGWLLAAGALVLVALALLLVFA